MKIIVSYRGIPHAPGWEIGASIARGFRQLGHQVFPYGNVYQRRDRIGELPPDPDLLVWVECNDADPQYTELFKLTCPKVLVDWDTAMHPDGTAVLVAGLKPDLFLLGNRNFVSRDWPGAKRVGTTTFAVDPTLTPPGTGPRSGAAIIGTAFPKRVEFAREAGVEMVQAYGDEYARTVQGLQLHVHHTTTAGDDLFVTRNWETLGTGTALLTKDTPEVRRYFTPGEHLFTYQDDAEAIALIKSLLDDPEHLAAVALAGHREAMAHHTYRHRAQEILEAM